MVEAANWRNGPIRGRFAPTLRRKAGAIPVDAGEPLSLSGVLNREQTCPDLTIAECELGLRRRLKTSKTSHGGSFPQPLQVMDELKISFFIKYID